MTDTKRPGRRSASIQTAAIGRRAFAAGAAALAAVPFGARAQVPSRTYRIAMWHVAVAAGDMTATSSQRVWRPFFEELSRLGFDEGKNLVVERYGTESRPERYAPTARRIVDSKPDLIWAQGTSSVQPLLGLTTTIPIVAGGMGDPLASQLVTSIARPGGNLTGFTIDGGIEIYKLRLELLKDVSSPSARIGYLLTPSPASLVSLDLLQKNAPSFGVEIVPKIMDRDFTPSGYAATFAEFARQNVGGLLISAGSEHVENRKLIVTLATAAKWPTLFPFREAADDGALMSFGPDLADNYRRSAAYVARILKGDKPGDLPIQQPVKYECVINLRTAQELGIEIPILVLARATDVIT